MMNNQERLFLLSEDLPGLYTGADPRCVADAHPVWAESMKKWGPWTEAAMPANISVAVENSSPSSRGMSAAWRSQPGLSARTIVCLSCSSVLDVGWHFLRHGGLRPWEGVMAVEQWAGRGQVRRPWQSLPGNLLMAWRVPAMPPRWDGLISLVPAWLTALVLARHGHEIRLKWPNDLLCHGVKVGGILVEQKGQDMLVGLGLNLATPPDATLLRAEAAEPAGSLDGRICPVTCWNALVSAYRSWYTNDFPALSPDTFVCEFNEMLAWKNQLVFFSDHSDALERQARVAGIEADGGLVLGTDDGFIRLRSGTIRLARE